MKLYKYRSLKNFEYIFDIIRNGNVHCSDYADLNDPFEGKFIQETVSGGMTLPMRFPFSFGNIKRDLKEIYEFYENERLKICSFSANCQDIKMWAFYADSHKGICVEFEVDEDQITTENELGKFHKVNYDSKIVTISDKSFTRENAFDIIRKKTKSWEYEEEYRLVNSGQNFSLQGKITGIILGLRISDLNKQTISELFGDFSIYQAILDERKSQIKI